MARSKFEKRGHARLERDGWTVDYKIRPRIVPKSYNVDYWNLFDLAAYKKNRALRFISIKGKSVPSDHRTALEQFTPTSNVQVEIWSYRKLHTRDRRVFYVKAQRWNGSEWVTIFDRKAIPLSKIGPKTKQIQDA